MFKKLQKREITGSPAQPKDVSYSYICVSLGIAPYSEELIRKTFQGHNNGCFAKSPKAENEVQSAKEVALQATKEKLKKSNFNMLEKNELLKNIDALKMEDFKKNMFLIFTMEGDAKEINELMSKKSYVALSQRIVCVEDNKGELRLNRDQLETRAAPPRFTN